MRITDPDDISVVPGVYCAVNKFALLNVPLPAVLQDALVADPAKDPESVAIEPAQTARSLPALLLGGPFIVSVIDELTGLHAPGGSFVVKVSVTIPAPLSAEPEVYTALRFAVLSKVPSPEVDHVPLAAVPPKVAAIVAVEPAQMV